MVLLFLAPEMVPLLLLLAPRMVLVLLLLVPQLVPVLLLLVPQMPPILLLLLLVPQQDLVGWRRASPAEEGFIFGGETHVCISGR